MEIYNSITLDDILDYIHINYQGVKEEIHIIAKECSSYDEFFDRFHEYYSDNGLGGDDTWIDCKRILPLVLNITEDDSRKSQIVYLKAQINRIKEELDKIKDFDDADFVPVNGYKIMRTISYRQELNSSLAEYTSKLSELLD